MNTLTGAVTRLPHLGSFRCSGPDANTFLQGQLSNDTRRLNEGSPLLAAYSSPQGRVVAVLHLLPHSSGIIALLPREIVLPTLERLRKYVMRAKVKLEDVSDQLSIAGLQDRAALIAAGLPVPDPAPGYVEHDGIGIACVAASPGRYWVIGGERDAASRGIADDDAEQAWRLADIRRGLPQIYAATREMFVAQMLNLDLLDGISFTKGCFTGQEIIARTQHLGRIKRRMFRLRLPAGSWARGQAVRLRDGRSGRLTEVAAVENEFEALAVLNMDSPTGPGGSVGGFGEADGFVTPNSDPGAAPSEVISASGSPPSEVISATESPPSEVISATVLTLPYPLVQAA